MTRSNEWSRRELLKYGSAGLAAGLAGCQGAQQTPTSTPGGGSTPTSTSGSGETPGSSDSGGPSVDLSRYESADIDWRAHEGEEIVFGFSAAPFIGAAQPELIPAFEELTGISVNIITYSEQEFRTKRQTDLTTGAGVFDGFWVDQVASQFWNNDWIAPMQQFMDDDSLFDPDWYDVDDYFDVAETRGQMYGLVDQWATFPVAMGCNTLYYRTDLYEKHGLSEPATFEELEANAKTIHEEESDVVGTASRGLQGYGANVYSFAGVMRGFGGSFWQEFPSDSGLDTQATMDAGRYYSRMVQQYGPDDVVNWSWPECLEGMQSGQVGHLTSETNAIYALVTSPASSQVADRVTITTLPEGPGGLNPNVFSFDAAISASSQHKEASFLLWMFLTSPPAQEFAAIEKGYPGLPRRSVYETDAYVETHGEQFRDATLASLENGSTIIYDVGYPTWAQQFSVNLQQVIGGSTSVEDAFAESATIAEENAKF